MQINTATQWHGFMPYQTWSGVLRDRNRTALHIQNRASCGIFSLHHAMVFLGLGANFKLLQSAHQSFFDKVWNGTSSGHLLRLAKLHHLKTQTYESTSLATIRKIVDRSLAAGHPLILGSEPQIHWICLGGRTEDGGYVWADSAFDPAVGGNWSWEEIEEWMIFNEKKQYYPELKYPFECITVAPGPDMPSSRSMVPWCGSLWPELANDPDYAGDWSNLLADMLEVFWDRDYAPKGVAAGEFLDQHIEGIVEAVALQTNMPNKWVLDVGHAYRDAADFHSLVVPSGYESQVIAGFTLKLIGLRNIFSVKSFKAFS